MITQLFSIIIPVFFGVGCGYLWVRSGQSFDQEFITNLVFNIGTPLLIFSTLTRLDVDSRAFTEIAMVTVIALLIFFVISTLILKIAGLSQRTYLAAIVIPNTGNVGLPLCFLTFGEPGLVFGIIIYTIVTLVQFTFGLAIASGSFSISVLFKNPIIYSVLVALFVMITEAVLPEWIKDTALIYGQFAIPLMLISLGASLAKIKVNNFTRNLLLSSLRLLMGFGVGLIISNFFQLDGVARGVVIIECSMPAAVFNYMLAMKYNNDPDSVAALVVTSTLLTFVCLPVLIAFVISL